MLEPGSFTNALFPSVFRKPFQIKAPVFHSQPGTPPAFMNQHAGAGFAGTFIVSRVSPLDHSLACAARGNRLRQRRSRQLDPPQRSARTSALPRPELRRSVVRTSGVRALRLRERCPHQRGQRQAGVAGSRQSRNRFPRRNRRHRSASAAEAVEGAGGALFSPLGRCPRP